MPTVKLVASNYSVTGTVTAQNPSNMYTDVSSNTYATLTHTTSGTSSYYCYIKGFNFSSVPSNAIVSSITIRIRGYESGLSTSVSYAPRLYNGTITITGASTASANFGASASTITVPYTGTWDTLKGCGADLGIRVTIRRSARNTQGYLYIYGAEIEVTYTVPVYHNVSIQNSTSADVQASDTNPLEGDDVTISTDTLAGLTIKDNGTDVTSQFVAVREVTETGIPNGNTVSGFTASNIANAYADADSSTYADLTLAGRATGTLYLPIGGLSIPTGATIKSVTAKATLQFVPGSSTSGFMASCQMYAGNTAKGSATTVVSSYTAVPKTTFTLSAGSWTASEIANARFYLTATNNASSTQRHMYVYGVSFIVTYESDNVIYIYTITAIAADHTIVVTSGGGGNPPVITVGTPSRTRISAITSYDQCVCTFTSDLALQAWEARATKAGVTPARGVGLLVESGGALAANTPATVYVENEELTQGDGEYTITVYGLSTAGIWSE